jgi:hypothetical protein
MKNNLKLILTTLLLTIFAIDSYAELPPSVYIIAKENAQEKLKIIVQEVNVDSFFGGKNIKIKAKVLDIYQTKGILKKNDIINIVYSKENMSGRWIGPSQNYILKKDKIYMAYLAVNKDGEYYPDARGQSFETESEADFTVPKVDYLKNVDIDYQTGNLKIIYYDKFNSKTNTNDIPIIRRYNSANDYKGLLGRGWSLNFDIKIVGFDDDSLIVFLPEIDKKVIFKKIKNNKWRYNSTTYDKYIVKEDDRYILTRAKHNCKDIFDKDGKIIYSFIGKHKLSYKYNTKDNSILITNNFNKSLKIYKTNDTLYLENLSNNTKETFEYILEKKTLVHFKRSLDDFDFYRYDKEHRLFNIYEPLNKDTKSIKYDKTNKVIEISSIYFTKKIFTYKTKDKISFITSVYSHDILEKDVQYIYNKGKVVSLTYSKILKNSNYEIITIKFDKDMDISYYNAMHGIFDCTEQLYENKNIIEYSNRNGTIKITYDKNKNIKSIIPPDKKKISFEYNEQNKPTKITFEGYGVLNTIYDKNGNVIKSYATRKDKNISKYRLSLRLMKMISGIQSLKVEIPTKYLN